MAACCSGTVVGSSGGDLPKELGLRLANHFGRFVIK
jgi:hypothetical protein